MTSAAPYRHFADRDQLLAAAAIRVSAKLSSALTAEQAQPGRAASRPPGSGHPGLRPIRGRTPRPVQTLYTAGLDKTNHPELQRAAQPIVDAFVQPAQALTDGDPTFADDFALAVAATAHGYATLLLDDV